MSDRVSAPYPRPAGATVTALHVPYKTAFEPIVNHGEYVALPERQNLAQLRFYRVLYIEPVPPQVVTLYDGRVDPGQSVTARMEFLELYDGELGQWRVYVTDPYLLRLYSPEVVPKYATRNLPGVLSTLTPGNMAEFYTFEDATPRAEIINPYDEPLVNPRLLVAGYRYLLEEVAETPERYTFIPLYSLTAYRSVAR